MPTLVQSGGVTSTSNTTGFTVTLSQATAAGNLLAIYIGARLVAFSTTSSTVDSASNTLTTFAATGSTSGAAAYAAVAYEINCPSGITSVTVTFTGNCTAAFWFEEWSGVSTGAIDATASAVTAGTTTSTAISSGGVVTTNANDLLLSSLGTLGVVSFGSFTGGFTTDTLQQSTSSTGTGNCQAANRIVTSTGTYTFAATLSQTEKNAGVVVAFKAGGGTDNLTSTAAEVATGTATLTEGATLTSTGAEVATGTATLTSGLAESGTGAETSTGAAALTVTLSPTGTGAEVSTGTANVTSSGGSTDNVSGTGAEVSTGTGSITASEAKTGTGAEVSTGAAGLTTGVAPTGTGSGVSTGTATVKVAVSLQGTAATVETGTAALGGTLPLTGTGAGTSAGTANVSTGPIVTYTWLNAPPGWQPWNIPEAYQVASWDTETYVGPGLGVPPALNQTVLAASVLMGTYTLKVWIDAASVQSTG